MTHAASVMTNSAFGMTNAARSNAAKSGLAVFRRRAAGLLGIERLIFGFQRARRAAARAAYLLAAPCLSCSITWSTPKLPAFWLGGNSLNVSMNLPTSACAGTQI